MQDDQLLARLRQYLEQNRSAFTIEALRKKLIAEGVPPDAVDLAIAQTFPNAYSGPGVVPAVAPRHGWSVVRILLVIGASAIFNAALIFGGGLLMITNEVWAIPVVVGGALIFVAEVVGAIVVSRRNSSVTLGLLLGIVATPPLVILILAGACFGLILAYG
jgi:hypothetical protein